MKISGSFHLFYAVAIMICLLAVGCAQTQQDLYTTFPAGQQTLQIMDLHNAAEKGDIVAVTDLLAKGADVNAKNNSGRTPLHIASLKGHKDVVQLLLDKGAEVNAANNSDGLTPLHHATFKGYIAVIQLLLAKGADVNAKTNEGHTPLYIATIMGHNDVAQFLLDKSAEVNARQTREKREVKRIKLVITKSREYSGVVELSENVSYKNLESALSRWKRQVLQLFPYKVPITMYN